MRVCTNSNYQAHSRPLFFRLRTLNVYDIHKIQTAILMFNVFNNISPKRISQMFILNKSVHSYNTRSSNKYHYQKFSTQQMLNSVKHNGPRIWNEFNNEVTNCTTISSFKVRLKTQILSTYAV